MRYDRIYDQLIARRIAQPPAGHVERHHILPRALGGTNAPENLVLLTAREHLIAHYLLARIHGGSMWVAVVLMKGRASGHFNSRQHERAKTAWAEWLSTNNSGKTSWNYGAKRSEETKKKIGDAQRGEKNHRFGSALSDEQKALLSAMNKGRKISPEHLAKNIANRTGRTHSEETKAAYRAARKGRPAHPNTIAAVIASNKRRAALK